MRGTFAEYSTGDSLSEKTAGCLDFSFGGNFIGRKGSLKINLHCEIGLFRITQDVGGAHKWACQ